MKTIKNKRQVMCYANRFYAKGRPLKICLLLTALSHSGFSAETKESDVNLSQASVLSTEQAAVHAKIRGFLKHLGDGDFDFAATPTLTDIDRKSIVGNLLTNRENSVACVDISIAGWNSWKGQHILNTLFDIATKYELFLEASDVFVVSSLMLINTNKTPTMRLSKNHPGSNYIPSLQAGNRDISVQWSDLIGMFLYESPTLHVKALNFLKSLNPNAKNIYNDIAKKCF